MSNKTVLVAEDSSVIQNLTKKILEFQNFSIVGVKNGADVLKVLEDLEISLILMDINMPIMDGIQCAKAVRALSDPVKRSTPIIAITGNAKNYSDDDFQSAGISAFLQKPLNFDLLVEKVKEFAK